MSQTSHLPVMGVGPIYVINIVIITIFAIIFGHANTSLPTNIQAPNTPVTNSTSSNLTSVSDSTSSGTQSVSQFSACSSSYSVSSSISSPSKSKSPKPSKRTDSSLLVSTPLFATPSTLPGSFSVLAFSFLPVRFF